ncbi:hypothetical protein [Ectobacillus polymachus]|uniref:hypothetical protein n=1 Tax=Ectobacillus polymachus TaxID=1508806 RepID=UPI003A8882AD
MRKIMITLIVVLTIGRGWEWYIQETSTTPFPEESRSLSENDMLSHPIHIAQELELHFDN